LLLLFACWRVSPHSKLPQIKVTEYKEGSFTPPLGAVFFFYNFLRKFYLLWYNGCDK